MYSDKKKKRDYSKICNNFIYLLWRGTGARERPGRINQKILYENAKFNIQLV